MFYENWMQFGEECIQIKRNSLCLNENWIWKDFKIISTKKNIWMTINE